MGQEAVSLFYYSSVRSTFRGSCSSALKTYPHEQTASSTIRPLLVNTSTSFPHTGHVLSSGTGVLYWLSQPSITAIVLTSCYFDKSIVLRSLFWCKPLFCVIVKISLNVNNWCTFITGAGSQVSKRAKKVCQASWSSSLCYHSTF